VALNVTNRRPINIQNFTVLRTYASTNSYYFGANLRDGMKVLFSASYGKGEAAQASGVVVEKNGRFYFQMKSNPSSNLLLPPGLSFNSNNQTSLWDLQAYMELINRVAFSEPNSASHTTHDIYDRPDAALVDFRGGTAGQEVTYTDAMEVGFTKSIGNRSQSDLKVYYGRGVGPVALEFTENMAPSGTFKFYLGD